MSRKSFYWLFAFAAVLRLLFIWVPPLWYDENFSLVVARLPWAQFWQAILGDVHPPLYYLIIRPIAQLTSIPWLIRLPSVIFSLAALWLAWKIFLRWASIPVRVQTAALILMAILPTQLWFAQEARMYALLEFLVMLGFYAFQRQRWQLLTLANILLLYTQNYGLFYMAIFGLLVLLSWRWKALPAFIIPIICWSPWIYVLLGQMHNIQGKYWITAVFTSPASLLNLFPQLFFGASMPGQMVVFGWLLLFAALILGSAYLIKERPRHWLTYLLMSFGPMVLAIIASLLWQPVMLYRPLLGSASFLCLLVCWPLGIFDSIPLTLRKSLYLAIFILPVLVSNLIGYYVYAPQLKGVEINEALAYVRAHWQPGDLIVHTGDGSMVNILPYAADLPQVRIIDCESAIGSLSDQTRKALGVEQITIDELANRVIADKGRAWFFAQQTPLDPPCLKDQLWPVIGDTKPTFVIDDNEYISSGVWLLEGK